MRYHLNKIDDKMMINCFKKWQEYCRKNPEEFVENSDWLAFVNNHGIQKVKTDFPQNYLSK